jgi:outer membrane protein
MNVLALLFGVPLLLQAAPSPSASTTSFGASGSPPPAAPAPSGSGGPPLPGVTPPPNAQVLHLDDAVQTAIKNQPSIAQAQAVTRGQEAVVTQARSGYLPQVSATGSYQYGYGIYRTQTATTATGAATGGAGGASTNALSSAWSFGLTGSQLIYDFGQTYDKTRAASRQVESFRASERVTELTVLLNVRRAYFTARADRALVEVAQKTLANEQKHMAQVQGFVTAGTHAEIDLAQERSNLANDRVQLITSQNNYAVARSQLNQAMGVIGSLDYEVADEEIGPLPGEDESADSMMPQAIANRPEILTLEKQRESQRLTVSAIRGAYGPSLLATGAATEAGPALSDLNPTWYVGALLSWPIFQGGLTTGQVHQAEANVDASDAQIAVEKLQVRVDVETALLGIRAAKASIDAANDALLNARELLRQAEGQYTAGVGTIIQLSDSQVTLTNAEAQVVQAQFNLATARAQLLTAVGRR